LNRSPAYHLVIQIDEAIRDAVVPQAMPYFSHGLPVTQFHASI